MPQEDVEVEDKESEEDIDVGEMAEESQSAPIVKIVSLILNEAMKRRASDIHIEPCKNKERQRHDDDRDGRKPAVPPKILEPEMEDTWNNGEHIIEISNF